MTKKQLKGLAIALGAIAIVAIGATIYFAWPKPTSATMPSAEQVPTATSLPEKMPVLAEAVVARAPMVSTEPASAVAETASCCKTVYVDLKTAPEGVWSNASALLLSEGWCAVLERDQTWQQARDETELRLDWREGGTEDFLLLCAPPGLGTRYFSLEEEYGGRPREWWNDQAKKAWFFCLEDGPSPTIAVLYEHDGDQLEEGWALSIGTDGKVSFTPAAVPLSGPEVSEQPTSVPVALSQVSPELPQPTQPAPPTVREFSLSEDLRKRSDVQILNDRSSWNGRANGMVSLIRIPEGSQVKCLFQRWGPPGVWNQVEAEKLVTLGQGVYDLTSWENGIFNDALQRVVIERGTVVLCENSDGSGITITLAGS